MYQDLFRTEKMTFNGLTLEYALEGNSNFIAWKDHMEDILDDNGFLEYIKRDVAIPAEFDVQNLA